jgi:hypothetical protein
MDRLRFTWLALLAGCLMLVACNNGDDDDSVAGDDDAADDDATADDDDDATAGDDDDVVGDVTIADPTDPALCDALVEGMNTDFDVDGEERSFILTYPDGVEDDGPWPIVFNFHGLGDTATNMETLLSSQVNHEDLQFILVTPEDTDYPMMGFPLDWAVFEVDDVNKEARLFDEVLACMEYRYGVDTDHIHGTGFSIGSIAMDMIASLRPEYIASLATYSGGYWNNVANEDKTISWAINWPEYDNVDNLYTQMFIHGGPQDIYNLAITEIPFYQYAENDSLWMRDMGHDTILCNHESGHTVPMSFLGSKLVGFFADHPRGTFVSPYRADGLPDILPDYCEFLEATQ